MALHVNGKEDWTLGDHQVLVKRLFSVTWIIAFSPFCIHLSLKLS